MKIIILVLNLLFPILSYSNELKIHIIEPWVAIDWTTPSSLGITSGLDSIRDDYAPIGHFAVEINCKDSNIHLLTGMERQDKRASQKFTIKQKLGLGSLYYPFPGALQTSVSTKKELILARKDNRLETLIIPTSSSRCHMMVEFIKQWIAHGSYNVYGGAKNTAQGEGAGCADFAMELFKIATQIQVPATWSAKIKIPSYLIGNGQDKKVNFIEILTRFSWANENEYYRDFEIADTSYVTRWIFNHTPLIDLGKDFIFTFHLKLSRYNFNSYKEYRRAAYIEASTYHEATPLKPFLYQYQTTIPYSKVWRSIQF